MIPQPKLDELKRLICSRCTIGPMPGTKGDPCPDRFVCIEDGPDPEAILVESLAEADAWAFAHPHGAQP